MSSKYANLPDIDTARDVYETQDDDDDERLIENNERDRDRDDEHQQEPGATFKESRVSTDELDRSKLPDRDGVEQQFRKAEKRKVRKTVYAYPPSPAASRSPSPSSSQPPLRTRLKALQKELAALEAEAADPANIIPSQDADGDTVVDTSDLIKGLVEVRGRLNHLSITHLSLGRREELIDKVVRVSKVSQEKATPPRSHPTARTPSMSENKLLSEMDSRVAELEKLLGSNSIPLDESSPLPPPLLPQITRMANQLNLLAQPRHIDSISRRLKLLQTELERHGGTNKRQSTGISGSKDAKDNPNGPAPPTLVPADLAPILHRLSPLLPTIPHLLQRLRTLSALHTSASNFSANLSILEEEQKRVHANLGELTDAIKAVEVSIGENAALVEGNLKSMEGRVDELMARLGALGINSTA